MGLVPAYHTLTDPQDRVYHVYDDCPSGEIVRRNHNNLVGENGWPMCEKCARKTVMGHF